MAVADFKNCVLIASPHLIDENFERTVTYIFNHGHAGSAGLIINKPLNLSFTNILKGLEIRTSKNRLNSVRVCRGGPVEPTAGFLLHEESEESQNKKDGYAFKENLGSSKRYLEKFSALPQNLAGLFAIGHAGWGPGQLEEEIRQGFWLYGRANKSILFEVPFEERWSFALKALGIEATKIGPYVGHA